MSERRCPNCGGLVGADAEWCTQCFTRLVDREAAPAEEAEIPGEAAEGDGKPPSEQKTGPAEPATSTPEKPDSAAANGERIIRKRGEAIVWACPSCGTENPIDAPVCSACGTPFRKVLQEPQEQVSVDPGRAAMFSLAFPGVGHYLVGRTGEALARAVVFLFALIVGIVSIGAVRRGSGGAYTFLMVVSLGFAAALYVLSTLDAGREAEGHPPLLPSRVLMYGGVGLMLLTLGVVLIGGLGARG